MSVLAESARFGRLSTYPVVDDVSYMSTGARFLLAFEERGFLGVLSRYLEQPPHSPYAGLICFVAYLLAGVVDWAPHAANGLALLVALMFVARSAQRLRALPQAALLVCVALTPVWAWSIEIVKPDYLAATISACVTVGVLRGGSTGMSRRQWVWMGALTGLAILVKPVAFPAPLFALGSAALGQLAASRVRGKRPPLGSTVASWAAAGGAAAVVAAPHFIVGGHHVVRYFWANVFGERSGLWSWEGSWVTRLTYFLTGPNGEWMLGEVRWALMAAILAAIAVVARRRSRVELACVVGWAVTLALLNAFVLANPMRIREFGLPFQLAFLFAGVEAMIYLLRRQSRERWRFRWAAWLVYGSAAVAAAGFAWPFPRTVSDRSELVLQAEQNVVAESVFSAVKTRALRAGHPQTLMVVGAPGDLGRALFTVWAVRDRAALRVVNFHRVQSQAAFARRLSEADLVLANEGGTGMTRDRHGAALNGGFHDLMRKNPGWVSIGRWAAPGTNAHFELFEPISPREPRTHEEPEEGEAED